MEGFNFNPLNEIVSGFHEQLLSKFDTQLEAYLRKNLAEFGYTFETQEAFFQFVKRNIHRVEFQALEEVHYYINYKDEKNMGTLVGLTHENRVRIDYSEMPNKITATIG